MSFIFKHDIFVSILFGACIFTISYLMSDKVINFFYKRSIGSKVEIIDLIDKMLLDIDKKKFTNSLFVLSFGLGFITFILLWPNIIMSTVVSTIVILASWSLPKAYLKSMWEKRCNRIVDQMVDGMTIMANGIKSGLSVPQSMERIVSNINGPLADEFSLILNKLRLGMSVEDALLEFSVRIPRADVQIFVTSINILKETGGNLAETFDTIAFTIRERLKIQRKIEALTASSLMQGKIIAAVPFVLLGGFLLMDPAYVMPLFTKPLGWFALFMILLLQTIGGTVMKKVVTIKV